MRRRATIAAFVCAVAACAAATVRADSLPQAAAPEAEPDRDSLATTTPEQVRPDDEQLKFLAYFFTRAEMTNVSPTNDLLQGRVVGRLFGTNTTHTGDTATLAEQRLIPFIIFEPRVLDHFARLRASFEINWTWGDTSYSTGGNFGGALSGRSVNLETQNVEVELRLHRGWYADIGLQRLWDNVRNPYTSFFSTLALTGDRLALWGSDAVGATVYGFSWGQLFKLGAYVLYANKVQQDDHVLLFEALTGRELAQGWFVGGGLRWLRDTSSGAGGVSVLGQGPDSALADYNGAFRFPLNGAHYHADFIWADLHASVNPEFAAGRFGGSAFVIANFGNVRTQQPSGVFKQVADVLGLAADLRLGYRFGNTRNDVITGELTYTTGDQNGIADGRYTGFISGNTYGAPAAPFVTSGAYLLLPQSNVVNRFYAAVFDLSNQGLGLTSGTLNVSYDFFRNKLTAKVGTAAALSNVAPHGGGNFIGVEANAMVAYRLKVFLTVELHCAYLWLGDFYDSPSERPEMTSARPANPWTTFVDLKWLMF